MSYHFLSAGHNATHAVCVTGRLTKSTTWVPLEKSQSIRRVQGPAQRVLGLATVHVDVAGRRTRAEFRDRGTAEADALVEELTALSRSARKHGRRAPAGPGHRRRPLGLVPRPRRPARAALLAPGSLDGAGERRRAAQQRGGYAPVKRIGKWSMERMPEV